MGLFENGERCFSGIVRSLKVQFECGENYVVETATWMSWMSYSRGWWTGGIGQWDAAVEIVNIPHLVAHPTARKWVITPIISGLTLLIPFIT